VEYVEIRRKKGNACGFGVKAEGKRRAGKLEVCGGIILKSDF